MAATREQLELVISSFHEWFARTGVTCMYVDKKIRGGQRTKEDAIVVGVIRKRPASQIDGDDFLIPGFVEFPLVGADGTQRTERAPTDVLETGEFRPQNGGKINTNAVVRPCPGGMQVTTMTGSNPIFGTLGASFYWGGSNPNAMPLCSFSCNHVISKNGTCLDCLYQPNQAGGQIATVIDHYSIQGFSDLKSSVASRPVNYYDFAWATPLANSVNVGSVQGIAALLGAPRAPVLYETIQMFGAAKAQVETAWIVSISAQLYVDYTETPAWLNAPNGPYGWFTNCILLDHVCTLKGDSGALYVATSDNCVVGMNVAASSTGSFGSWWPGISFS